MSLYLGDHKQPEQQVHNCVSLCVLICVPLSESQSSTHYISILQFKYGIATPTGADEWSECGTS